MQNTKKILLLFITVQFLLTSSYAVNSLEQILLKSGNDHPALKRIEAQIKKEHFYKSLRESSSHLKKIIAIAERNEAVPVNYEDPNCFNTIKKNRVNIENRIPRIDENPQINEGLSRSIIRSFLSRLRLAEAPAEGEEPNEGEAPAEGEAPTENQEITLTDEEIKVLKKRVKRLDDITDGDWGDILLNGIAGKHAKYAAVDLVGNNKLNGIKKGSALLLVGEASNAAGSIVEDFSKKGFGKLFQLLEGSLSYMNRLVFHKGKKPFTELELNAWKELISKDLREIETMIKGAEKFSSRGKEEILRMLESEFDAENEKAINLWLDFINDLASTCEQLAQEIKNRQQYYKNKTTGFGITSTAEHLVNKLLIMKNWLTSVNSVKDLAAMQESKQIIPAMKRSIENYFNNLLTQIKPLDSKVKSTMSNNRSSSRNDRWDRDDDYPGMVF